MSLFRESQIGFVTPLHDGMNLVAKEYVAAQNPDDPGVLVLSIFAGAAAELTGALLVNPHDVVGMCEALQRALQMPLDERQRRHEINMAALRKNDLGVWRDTFSPICAACLQKPGEGAAQVMERALSAGAFERSRPHAECWRRGIWSQDRADERLTVDHGCAPDNGTLRAGTALSPGVVA